MVTICVLGALSYPSYAQDARAEPTQITESGTKYLRAIRMRGIDTEVAYFDPSRPSPSLETRHKIPPVADETDQTNQTDNKASQNEKMVIYAICGVILAFGLYFVVKFGGATALTFRSQAANPTRKDAAHSDLLGEMAQSEPDLRSIIAQPDRRIALVQLMLLTLRRAATDTDLRIQQSWTVRDALRHLPKTWPYLDVLQQISKAAELARFGGRDVTEAEFKAHLQNVRPVFSSGAA